VRVLVTGARGFSGTNVIRALLAAGHEVYAVAGRKGTDRLRHDQKTTPNLTVLVGDLAERVSLPDCVDAVVHTAAVSPGPGIVATADDFARNNTEVTRRLVRWAKDHGAKVFIYFSSVSVFGRIDGPVVDEKTLRVEPDAYGVSKWMGEVFLSEQEAALASLSLRLPSVIGPKAVRNWPSTMVDMAKEGREIVFFHGDAAYNNAVHVDDLCRLVVGVLAMDLKGHDVVTLGADGTMKVRDMVSAIARGFGNRSPIREIPAPRPAFTISSERAKQRYGYQPMAMPDMIARFVAENRN